MNDNIDNRLYQYFKNVDVPEELDIVIENAFNEKEKHKNKLYHQYILKVASVLIIFVLIGSIVFAKNIANYITELFAHTHQGVVKALENGYVTSIDMDYIYSTETGVKIDSIIMDEFNLIITFKLRIKENFEDIRDIKIPDLMITDENNNIIFCDYENVEGYEEFCKKNNIEYSKMNMHNNYTDNGYATEITEEDDQIAVTYKAYSSGYPRSKRLYIDFKNIILESRKLEDGIITKTGGWKIQLDLPEEFYNREVAYYVVKDGSDKANNIRITNAVVSNTETKISFTNIVEQYMEVEESEIEEKMEAKLEELLNEEGIFYNDIEIENENGEIFKRTAVNDAGGIIYNINGSITGTETFTMTKYDMTDTIKIRMIRGNKEIIINLTRK